MVDHIRKSHNVSLLVFHLVCPVKRFLWGGEFWTDGHYINTVGQYGNFKILQTALPPTTLLVLIHQRPPIPRPLARGVVHCSQKHMGKYMRDQKSSNINPQTAPSKKAHGGISLSRFGRKGASDIGYVSKLILAGKLPSDTIGHMKKIPGLYQETYIKRKDGFVSLKSDVRDFCEKYLKPLQEKNWDWSKRDFSIPKNKPTLAEAKAIRQVVYKDMLKSSSTEVNLSSMKNREAIKSYLKPPSKYEEANMKDFAYALDVELEHGRLNEVNVTSNHPFLTAMIALSHLTETTTYYKRLKIMETEGALHEILRKLKHTKTSKNKWHKELSEKLEELDEARKELGNMIEQLEFVAPLKEIED